MALAVAALLGAIGLEVGAYGGSHQPAVATNVTLSSSLRNLDHEHLSLSARFGLVDRTLQVVAFPIQQFGPGMTIQVFDDASFPYAGSSSQLVSAIRSRIAAQTSVQEPDITVSDIDATGLNKTLRAVTQAPTTVVLALSGTLPSQTFSPTIDLVSPWVEAGGIFVWAGDAIGYYSVSPGDRLDPNSPKNPRAAGPPMLIGLPAISFPTVFGRVGVSASHIAAALSLHYAQASSGVLEAELDRGHGLDLGFSIGGLTSIAFLPRGRGGYLLFGGAVGDSSVIGDDIGRILLSRALLMTADVATTTISARGLESVDASLEVAIPKSTKGVRVVATGSDSYPFFVSAITVTLESSA